MLCPILDHIIKSSSLFHYLSRSTGCVPLFFIFSWLGFFRKFWSLRILTYITIFALHCVYFHAIVRRRKIVALLDPYRAECWPVKSTASAWTPETVVTGTWHAELDRLMGCKLRVHKQNIITIIYESDQDYDVFVKSVFNTSVDDKNFNIYIYLLSCQKWLQNNFFGKFQMIIRCYIPILTESSIMVYECITMSKDK